MRTEEMVLEQMQSILNGIFAKPVQVRPELRARDFPEWDSLSQIMMIMELEERNGIRFDLGEVETAETLGAVAQLVLRRQGQA